VIQPDSPGTVAASMKYPDRLDPETHRQRRRGNRQRRRSLRPARRPAFSRRSHRPPGPQSRSSTNRSQRPGQRATHTDRGARPTFRARRRRPGHPQERPDLLPASWPHQVHQIPGTDVRRRCRQSDSQVAVRPYNKYVLNCPAPAAC
jgi:hypothetical protein